jgi:starch phosphorylase
MMHDSPMDTGALVAYFSMEMGIEPDMPTYSGGLGMLAGDTIRSAADLRVPLVAVTMSSRRGYFYQSLDAAGQQSESPVAWPIEDFATPLPERVTVTLEGRPVVVRAWRHDVRGGGRPAGNVHVLLLDTDLPENDAAAREITHFLYGGDQRYRLLQEAVLGIGGLRLLRALGFGRIAKYHMNEGHAALLAAELLREELARRGWSVVSEEAVMAVRRRCVFTTHTPVPAGHDAFPRELVHQVLGVHEHLERSGLFTHADQLNMTYAALNLSEYVNGVAKRHGEVSRRMFVDRAIDSITNGVHPATWTSRPFQELYDRHIPDWRIDTPELRSALAIPSQEVRDSHVLAKRTLINAVNRASNAGFEPHVPTLGFARRMTAYKRPDLLFSDLDRLRAIAQRAGPMQVVFAGKAHPRDTRGKELIHEIHSAIGSLRADSGVRAVYLPNYEMEVGRLMTSGVDVWLNTPEPPLEASGTSGMKAAMNGVPSLSVLDGWWVEGCIEGITGWAIGAPLSAESGDRRAADADSLYDKLERVVLPLVRDERAFAEVMKHVIAINASFFNTQRMMQQYVLKAYFT